MPTLKCRFRLPGDDGKFQKGDVYLVGLDRSSENLFHNIHRFGKSVSVFV
jgi:hypothetical protein